MQGLQRATEAARASRGRAPRIVHARSIAGGNNTMCGRGGITFSAPIADAPDEVTCGNCSKVQRSNAATHRTVALFQDERWTDLREEIQHLRTAAYDVATDLCDEGRTISAERAFGKTDALDQVLALMAHTSDEKG